MMQLTFDEKLPIYMQIMDMIKSDIVTHKVKGGDKLPSVREMSENLKVNPNTVQRVYQELERENVTFTQRGMGTFVTEDEEKLKSLKIEMSKEIILNFRSGMESLGFSKDEIIKIVSDCFNEEVL
jgi:GntR family transcriptional regulator